MHTSNPHSRTQPTSISLPPPPPTALKAGSKFLLNGDWLIDWPGEVDAGGTLFTYARNEDESESLSALGPTSEDITLMVRGAEGPCEGLVGGHAAREVTWGYRYTHILVVL